MSGINRTIRLKPLRAAMRLPRPPIYLGLAGLLLLQGSGFAATPAWDCRMAADGRSWECFKDGQRVDDPVPEQPAAAEAPDGVETTPLTPDATPPATPLAPTPPVAAPEATPIAPTSQASPDRAAQRPSQQPATPASPQPQAKQPAQPRAAQTAPATEKAAPAAQTRPAFTQPLPAKPRPTAPAKATAAPAAAAIQAFDSKPASPDLLTAEPATSDSGGPADSAAAQPSATRPETVAEARMATPELVALDSGLDWHSCRQSERSAGARPDVSDEPTDAPIRVTADSAVAEMDPQTALFEGNVMLVQGDLQIQAGELRLNRSTDQVDASGGLTLSRPDLRVAGDSATYQLSSRQGEVQQASYRIPAIRARGDAESAAFLGNGISQYRNITYTTCAPGQDDWLLEAEALELDHKEGRGTARNAKLRFLGAPVLYVPTFTFPIDDRRRSGLLVPSVGYSDNAGFDVSVPYYLNLAPDYDLTLTPRVMSKRGLMLGGEFRFLTETTEGTLAAEFLPNDSAYEGNNNDRGSFSLQSHSWFNQRTEAALRLNYVSDSDYQTDLGSSLAATSATHVERAGEVEYHGDTWDLLGRAQYYQTIDDTIAFSDRPYSRLPQLRIDLENPDGLSGTTYHLDAEYVNFYRRQSVRGHRLDLFPAISLPLRNAWSYIEPKIGARYTAYRLTGQAAGASDTPSELSGLFSVDSGLYFDRSTSYFGNAATQTLEPRLYYLLVPNGGQDDHPVFDTAALDFNFDNLFRENRFNGPDRFGDANQVTMALTSRVLSDKSGAELLRASVGHILYFDDRDVTLPGETVADDSTSAVVGEVAAELGGGWRTRAGLQWDPHDGSSGTIDQALAQVNYRDDRRRIFNAAYRLRDGVTQQTDLAGIWPINEKLSLIGRHNYSLKDNRLLEALAGIEYGKCCWRVRAIVRQYADGESDDHNLAFLLQLELNGLGRLGDDIDQTLERGIYGYRTDDQD